MLIFTYSKGFLTQFRSQDEQGTTWKVVRTRKPRISMKLLEIFPETSLFYKILKVLLRKFWSSNWTKNSMRKSMRSDQNLDNGIIYSSCPLPRIFQKFQSCGANWTENRVKNWNCYKLVHKFISAPTLRKKI